MTYSIITYGCQINKSDSERVTAVLENMGYRPVSKASEADLIVVNACSVRQSAVDRIYGKINDFAELKRRNAKCKIILTGCILKSDKEKLKNKVDLILDIKDLPNWPPKLLEKPALPQTSDRLFGEESYLTIDPKYSSSFSVLIPISNGCDNFCTYCVVPFTRGPLVCRDHNKILKEVEKAVKNEAKEIWLLGQNVNNYESRMKNKKSGIVNFAELLKQVNKIPGKFWIRFTSSHPKDFSDELIETMTKCKKVTPYLNLPVQSGDDKILNRMNRPYTVAQYKNLVQKIRATFRKYRKGPEKEIALSTDIIVGFPGETKKQFENTKKLLKEIKFDMAYIAQYSPRPETAASTMKDTIPPQEKKRRREVLTEILRKTALEKNKKYIGKEVIVLVEESRVMNHKLRIFLGKTRTYKTVQFQIPGLMSQNLVGQFVKVKVIESLPWGLKAVLEK